MIILYLTLLQSGLKERTDNFLSLCRHINSSYGVAIYSFRCYQGEF